MRTKWDKKKYTRAQVRLAHHWNQLVHMHDGKPGGGFKTIEKYKHFSNQIKMKFTRKIIVRLFLWLGSKLFEEYEFTGFYGHKKRKVVFSKPKIKL